MSGKPALAIGLALLAAVSLVAFGAQRVEAEENVSIWADGTVHPASAPVQRNGDVYTLSGNITGENYGIIIQRNNMTLDGAFHTVQGSGLQGSIGIGLDSNVNVTVKNTIVKGFEFGVELSGVSNITVIGNNLANNDRGIMFYGSENNVVTENTLGYNGLCGIYFHTSSHNIITGNTITSNHYGLMFYDSSYNFFYHNNFLNNVQQVSISAPGNPNFWNQTYPLGGNHWSGYAGPTQVDVYSGVFQNETGSDGLADTPYFMDMDNQDFYPLMHPYIIPELPSLLTFLLLMIGTLLSVAAYKVRRRN